MLQVCHGQGSTREASQTDAARRALVLLADGGELNNEEKSSDNDNLFNGNGTNDSIPIVSAATTAAPPSENDNSCAWKKNIQTKLRYEKNLAKNTTQTDRHKLKKNYKFLFEFSRYYYIKNGAILIYQLGLLYKIVILDNLEIIN